MTTASAAACLGCSCGRRCGSGHTSPDVQGALFGTDDREFLLRAERSGTGGGRVYTITYAAEDASGNVTVGTATVSVPKSQR